MRNRPLSVTLIGLACVALEPRLAAAGPPFTTDDPEPTDTGHYEIYLFAQGMSGHSGSNGEGGIDFNYGAAPDLQLTAVRVVGGAGGQSRRIATSDAAEPAPMARKAMNQAKRLVSPPAKSSTAPTASGPRKAPVKPMMEWTASVAPRW